MNGLVYGDSLRSFNDEELRFFSKEFNAGEYRCLVNLHFMCDGEE